MNYKEIHDVFYKNTDTLPPAVVLAFRELLSRIDDDVIETADGDPCAIGDHVYDRRTGILYEYVHNYDYDGTRYVTLEGNDWGLEIELKEFKSNFSLYDPGLTSENAYSDIERIAHDACLEDKAYKALWGCDDKESHIMRRIKASKYMPVISCDTGSITML